MQKNEDESVDESVSYRGRSAQALAGGCLALCFLLECRTRGSEVGVALRRGGVAVVWPPVRQARTCGVFARRVQEAGGSLCTCTCNHTNNNSHPPPTLP